MITLDKCGIMNLFTGIDRLSQSAAFDPVSVNKIQSRSGAAVCVKGGAL